MHVQSPSDVEKEAEKVKIIDMIVAVVARGVCLPFFVVTERLVILTALINSFFIAIEES